MIRQAALALGVLVWAFAAGAAHAGKARGVAAEPLHVTAVEIVQNDAKAPDEFVDILRAAVLREAALYGEDGKPVTLKIVIDKVHVKNPVAAMLIGDDNRARGAVAVIDPETGAELGAFKVEVNAERNHAASVALFVVGALDPTGYVDAGTTVAQAGASAANRTGTEAAMGANFAAEALRQTFGDARAHAAHAKPPRRTAADPPKP